MAWSTSFWWNRRSLITPERSPAPAPAPAPGFISSSPWASKSNLEEYFASRGDKGLWLLTTKAPRDYTRADLSGDVSLMFGKETAGLPLWLREKYRDRCLRIPMVSGARSLNLSNSAAILAYEALRQQGFPGLNPTGEMAGE